MQLASALFLAMTAPYVILAAVIPRIATDDLNILPRAPAAESTAEETINPLLIRSAKFPRTAQKSTVLKREIGLDIRFPSDLPTTAMHFARSEVFKPHVLARHNEFFDLLQAREYVPMQRMH